MEQVVIHSEPQQLKDTYNRLDALLVLRGFACFMVVINHCAVPRGSIIYKTYDFTWILSSSGEVAVWIFFVLSGYLMGKAFYSERYTINTSGLLNFFRNRSLRIFPLYYFSTLILALFVTPEILKIENWGYLIRTLTFTYNYSMPGAVNGVVWSLAIEVQFYICVPFIYTFLKSCLFNRRQVILAFIYVTFVAFLLRLAVWIIFYTQLHDDELYLVKYWYSPLVMNFDIFLYGFLVNAWLKYKNKNSHKLVIAAPEKAFRFPRFSPKNIAVSLVLLLYLFTAYHYYFQELRGLPRPITGVRTSTTFFILQPLTALVTSFFIFAFESSNYQDFHKNEKLSFTAILKNPIRLLEIFGNLSYGVYIWHMPIMVKIIPIFTSTIPIEAFYQKLTATLLLSTLLSVVTYYLVELPATRWKIYRQTGTVN
ncbi:MAG TPA: acyltransferase [Candidatus Sericytochromatia bacterium]